MTNDDTMRESRQADDHADAVPRRGASYLTALVCALVVAAVTLGGLELLIRSKGGMPNVVDNSDRWALVRAAANADRDPGAIALIGASRLQSSIDLDRLAAASDAGRVYQLSIYGRLPWSSFADLAETSDFAGKMVVSLSPTAMAPGPDRETQKGYVDHYHRHWTWARALDARISNAAASRFVVLDDNYHIVKLLRNLRHTGSLIPPMDYLHMTSDRDVSYHFQRADVQTLRGWRYNDFGRILAGIDPISPEAWRDEVIAEIVRLTALFEARGGAVVFLYMPTSAELLALEETRFPHDPYWTALEDALPGRTLHFRDAPALQAFDLPDGSHIDAADKARMTDVLIGILRDRGMISD